MVVWKNALMPSTIHISVHIRGDRESCTTIYSNWKGYRKELGGSANILRNLQGSGRGSILWSLYLINTPLVTFFLHEKIFLRAFYKRILSVQNVFVPVDYDFLLFSSSSLILFAILLTYLSAWDQLIRSVTKRAFIQGYA